MKGAGLVTAPAADQAAEQHKAFCRQVRAVFPLRRQADSPPACREVVAIAASSRGGSSLLFDLLRSTGAFLCLEGEHSTLYKLHGLGLPAETGAHDGTVSGGDTAGFLAALASDVSVGTDAGRPGASPDAGIFATRAVRMLAQQWAGCPLTPAEAWEVIYETVAPLLAAGLASPDRLLLAIVQALRERGWLIDPWYFDVSPALVSCAFGGLRRPQGPPPALTQALEAPPFLVPSPARVPGGRDLRRPLLLKASMDAYRLPLLRRLFPDARLRLIHLTRNPAAAINGLIDGWLHHGFFSHNLANRGTLDIEGYSGTGAWGTSWWNFDLPPGWPNLSSAPLVKVCAAQWTGAHTSIMSGTAECAAEVLRLRAEDVFDARRRPGALGEVFRFCGVRPAAQPRARTVVATSPPIPGRWRARADLILPALADPGLQRCSARLGYGSTATGDWT